MLFTSSVFLFLFLPIVIFVNFIIKPELRNGWLCLASLFFYYWDESFYIIVMLVSIGINYLSALGIVYLRTKLNESSLRWFLSASVFANLIMLIVFKYTAFSLEILNLITLQNPHQMKTTLEIHLPLGISFFTFHGLSYVIDVYRKKVQAEQNLGILALYFAFFPQLIAGPIVRYRDVAEQLILPREFTREEFAEGVVGFTIGLFKKMVIANTVGRVADTVFSLSLEEIDYSHAYIGLLCYTLQIYYDFSGYSDMAIGLARIFGIRLSENFNYPYVSQSVKEFWRRWHISLSNWFRDYLYVSLGGNQVSQRCMYRNLLIVFLLCGLWHGASWNFIIWGLFHGTFLVLERTIIVEYLLQKVPRVFHHLYVLSVVSIGWVFFRSRNLQYSVGFIQILLALKPHYDRVNIPINQYLDKKVVFMIVLAICGSSGMPLALFRLLKGVPTHLSNKHARILAKLLVNVFLVVAFISLFLTSIMSIASGLYNPFIYFRFR